MILSMNNPCVYKKIQIYKNEDLFFFYNPIPRWVHILNILQHWKFIQQVKNLHSFSPCWVASAFRPYNVFNLYFIFIILCSKCDSFVFKYYIYEFMCYCCSINSITDGFLLWFPNPDLFISLKFVTPVINRAEGSPQRKLKSRKFVVKLIVVWLVP